MEKRNAVRNSVALFMSNMFYGFTMQKYTFISEKALSIVRN